jgi:hypothetical protein
VVLLAELGQALIALGFSGAIALWLGPTAYIVTAICVFVVCALLMFERAYELDRRMPIPLDKLDQQTALGGIMIVLSALLFGACWPSLPPILALGAWKRRRNGGSKNGV